MKGNAKQNKNNDYNCNNNNNNINSNKKISRLKIYNKNVNRKKNWRRSRDWYKRKKQTCSKAGINTYLSAPLKRCWQDGEYADIDFSHLPHKRVIIMSLDFASVDNTSFKRAKPCAFRYDGIRAKDTVVYRPCKGRLIDSKTCQKRMTHQIRKWNILLRSCWHVIWSGIKGKKKEKEHCRQIDN